MAGCDASFQGKKVLTVDGPVTIHVVATDDAKVASPKLEVTQVASNHPTAGQCLTAGERGTEDTGTCCKGYRCVSPKPGEHPACEPM